MNYNENRPTHTISFFSVTVIVRAQFLRKIFDHLLAGCLACGMGEGPKLHLQGRNYMYTCMITYIL